MTHSSISLNQLTLRFDPTNKYAFIADFGGQISVLKLEPTGFEFVTTLKGHQSEWVVYVGRGGAGWGRREGGREGDQNYFFSKPLIILQTLPPSGSIRSMCYDAERRVLFSGGFDELVVVWDIGSQRGTAFELMGHK